MSKRPSVPRPDEVPSPPSATAEDAPSGTVPVPGIVGPHGTGPAKAIQLGVPVVSGSDVQARRARITEVLARTPQERLRSAERDGRTPQGSLLVMPRIKSGHLEALEALLDRIAHPPDGEDFEINAVIPFLKLRSVHFGRLLIHYPSPSKLAPIPVWNGKPQAHGPAIPAKLLFATDFDGPFDEHFDELLSVAGPGLDQIFQHCEGWPGHTDTRGVRDFFLRNRVATDTFYTGTMGRSVDQIRREAELRDRIETFLDAETRGPALPTDPLTVRKRIQDFVLSQDDLEWARVKPGPFPKLLIPQWFIDRLPLTAGLVLLTAVALAIGILSLWLPFMTALATVLIPTLILAAIAGIGFFYLSRLAATDPVIIPEGVKEHTARLVEMEDRIVQNQMSSVIYIKQPLWFRRAVLWVVLKFINFSARYLSNQGALVGIPSIHFARWVIVDEGRRLVFFSNFDGSWENYLGDFIDKAHDGLTAVWSNCVGFPRTRGLAREGATDEQRFKAYSRASQIPTQVWYSAYKWLSVANINNNTRIRLGLYGDMSRSEAEAWLRRF